MSKRNIIITVSIAGAVIIFFLVYYGMTSSGSGTGSQTNDTDSGVSDLQPEYIDKGSNSKDNVPSPSVDIPEKPSYLSDGYELYM